MDQPNKKLDNKRARPFVIVEKIGPAGYKLNLPWAWHIHNVFNELLLTPYNALEFPTQACPAPPPPTIDDNHLEYPVEEILDIKKVGHRVKYLVKWLVYPIEENTWELHSNLTNVTLALQDFFHRYPEKAKLAGHDAQC